MFRGTSPEQSLHHLARLGVVHLSGIALFERGHDAAHILDALRADGSDGVLYRLFQLGIGKLLRQEALDDGDLAALLLGELGPAALLVERRPIRGAA